jgi:copper(I)-binding protein
MKVFWNVCLRLCVPLAVSFALATGAAAEGIAGKVTVTDPYVRAIPPVVKTTAAFMQLESSDSTERFLVAAETPVAAAVELHMHTMDDGVMRMRQIPHVHLPPNKPVALEPGGLHIMLFDLQAPLSPGDTVPLTLVFEDGSRKAVEAVVRPVGAMMHN